MAKSRTELRKARYQTLLDLGFTPEEARRGRDWSAARILRESGQDRVTKQDWAVMSSKRNKSRLFPNEVEAFAIRKNREVGADDFNQYGFVFAYKYYVEDLPETQIRLELDFNRQEKAFFYKNIRARG